MRVSASTTRPSAPKTGAAMWLSRYDAERSSSSRMYSSWRDLGDDLRGRVPQRPRPRWHRRPRRVEPDGVAPPAHRGHRVAVARQLLVGRARAEVAEPAVDLVGTRPGEEHGAQRGDERQPLPHLHAEPEWLGIAAATQQHDLLADRRARHALHPELVGSGGASRRARSRPPRTAGPRLRSPPR